MFPRDSELKIRDVYIYIYKYIYKNTYICVRKIYQSYGKLPEVKLGIGALQQVEESKEIFNVTSHSGFFSSEYSTIKKYFIQDLKWGCFVPIWLILAALDTSLESRSVPRGTELSLIWLETLCWLEQGQGTLLVWTWSKS